MPPNNLARHAPVLPRPSIDVVRGMGNPEWRAWERRILGIMPRQLLGWGGRNGFACCPETGVSLLLWDLMRVSQTLCDLLRRA